MGIHSRAARSVAGLVGVATVAAAVGTPGHAGGLQTATTASPAERCGASDLSPSLGQTISPETGEHGIVVRLTNRSSRSCSLSGYPGVSFLDGRRALPFRYQRGGQYGTGGRPRTVHLRRGGHAYFLAAKYRCDGRSSHSATEVRVYAPNTTEQLRLKLPAHATGVSDIAYCGAIARPDRKDPGNTIDLSPVSRRPSGGTTRDR